MKATRVKTGKNARTSQLESVEIDKVSNTKYQSPHRKYWIFTLAKAVETENKEFNPQEVIDFILKLSVEKYRFQLERGNESGYLHYQGFFELKGKGKRLENILSLTPKGIHLEPTRSVAAEAYCTKTDTRIEGPWIWPYEYRGEDLPTELYEWQHAILDEIAERPVSRRITWIWSTIGNVGKSKFCKYLAYHHKALLLGGKMKDAAFTITKGGIREKPIYLFDLARSNGNSIDYETLESLSNGIFFSPKYESETHIGPEPFIFVFANLPPQLARLSPDRWVVKEIREEDLQLRAIREDRPASGTEIFNDAPPLERADADAHIINWD